MLQEMREKTLREFINKRQATVAKLVFLRHIFEVCTKETGYKGGWRLRELWLQPESAVKQLKATLNFFLVGGWERRKRKSGRRDGGEGGEADSVSGSDG